MTELLEQSLTELGTHVRFPTTPDLSFSVRSAIESGQYPSGTRPGIARGRTLVRPYMRLPGSFARRVVCPALAAVVLVGAILGLSPAARTAVASWFHINGFGFSSGPVPGPLGQKLDLGDRTSLAGAQKQVSFRLLVPTLAGLRSPDEVYVGSPPSTGRVTLLYHASMEFPRASTTGVGLFITEFQGSGDPVFFKKLLSNVSHLDFPAIGNGRGVWIEGPPHVMYYVDANGKPLKDTIRLAGNVLIWQQGKVTLRLEGLITELRALTVAESMTPPSP
jgi:hypothetical protein